MSKIVKIDNEEIQFDDGHSLYSNHDSECCESHWLDFSGIELADVSKLEFDLSGNFFERVEDFGIKLLPMNGLPLPVPGYASNNGYYSNQLELILTNAEGRQISSFDITECQSEEW